VVLARILRPLSRAQARLSAKVAGTRVLISITFGAITGVLVPANVSF